MFDLARLRLLRELAHRGTMTAVGAAVGQTASAVSQQLAVLEREARTPLLERVGRRVRLTAAGEKLVAHAETILQAVEAAELDMAAASPSGLLEVGCFSSFAKARLLPATVRAQARFPGLRVAIHELEPADSIEAVRDGRLHLAITFAYNLAPHGPVAGLVQHLLMEEPVRLVLPKSWDAEPGPLALERLAGQDWIVGSRQPDDREIAERACALAGFAPRIAHTADDYDLLLRMVAAGFGVGFAPDLGLQFPSAKAVTVRTAAGPPLSRRIHALTRTTLAASPLVGALLSELGEANP